MERQQLKLTTTHPHTGARIGRRRRQRAASAIATCDSSCTTTAAAVGGGGSSTHPASVSERRLESARLALRHVPCACHRVLCTVHVVAALTTIAPVLRFSSCPWEAHSMSEHSHRQSRLPTHSAAHITQHTVHHTSYHSRDEMRRDTRAHGDDDDSSSCSSGRSRSWPQLVAAAILRLRAICISAGWQ
eukprot:COSAG06_NODE_4991_length_3803_cov_3.413337_3_plen_188_part_00